MKLEEIKSRRLKLDSQYELEVFDTINAISGFWDVAMRNEDVFLSVDYFKSLEKCCPEGLVQKYVLLWENEDVIALFPIQLSSFEAQESIKNADGKDSSKLRKSLAKCVRVNGLVAGNMIVSGEYMFRFLAEGFSAKEKFELLEKVLTKCTEYYQKESVPINVVFTKDIPIKRKIDAIGVKNSKFSSFTVEPLMVFHVKEEWKHFSDYLAELTSKYRVRAKRAFKKSAHLSSRELSLEEVESRVDEYFPLYMNVYEGLNFSLFKLPRKYFVSLKKHLGDKFRFYVMEDGEGKIRGFYTTIDNRGELHAHFLGYDKETNRTSQLYLTMLYKMVGYGIEGGYQLIDFGRTALEIKSSVGAVAHHYELYLKHTNSIANFFIGSVINILNKKTDWEARHPFKEQV